MRKLVFLFLAFVFCALIAAPMLGYPISPVPLWPLTATAELIVVATIEGVHAIPEEEGSWNDSYAELRVRETLKGPAHRRLGVRFPANLVCPAPPRYLEGKTMVAFLSERSGGWQTVSLSYGTLYPKGEALEDVTTMVKAAVAIQDSRAAEEKKQQKRLQWLVQAAALPGTRWHGLYELSPESDEVRSYYDRAERETFTLEPAHRTLLARAFVEAPRFDATMAMMLQILGDHPDTGVDQLALGTIEGLFTQDHPPWWVQELMWAFLERWGDEQPEKHLERLGGKPWEFTMVQLRQVWSEAKGQLDIPDVEPVDIEHEPYVPVGARTPS